jgi:methylphosphotriester-DNA--protein-cysteine methyltransferase
MVSDNLYPDFESKWEALSSRDEKAARCFFYCVKSTGIYCRPTCAARLARKKNVVFYNTVSEAEAAGFRPCKRCKPMLPLHESHHSVIRATCRLLDNSPKSAPGLKILAENVGFTQWHFHRVFRRFTGMTPRMYWEARHGKMAGKVEDLISQIAQLDENTVIDHELIKRSYKKTAEQAALPINNKMTPAPNVSKILPPSPNPSEEDDEDKRTELNQLEDLEDEIQKEVKLPFSPVDLFLNAATVSSNNESFGSLPVESFFYETSESALSPSESLDEYLSSLSNNETQSSNNVPGDEYFTALFDQSCLRNSINHNSNDNLFNHSSNVNSISITSSELELFDLETPLDDHEPFNLLDKSLGYYIFSQ